MQITVVIEVPDEQFVRSFLNALQWQLKAIDDKAILVNADELYETHKDTY